LVDSGFLGSFFAPSSPKDLEEPTDYQMFRRGIQAIWKDADSVHGGKWTIRLRKGLISYDWELLIMALIGEQFPADVVLAGAEELLPDGCRR
jgi:translation initiation factor 4E